MQKTVYLSLGSNLGDRATNLQRGIERLAALGTVSAVSSFYETEPVEYTAQPWFLNCAVALETTLMPKQLLAKLNRIEQELGRKRVIAKGPRVLDIDILLFHRSTVVDTPQLVIPHPKLHERRFVLEPLAEIAPELRHPVFHRTIRELRDALPRQGQAVRKTAAQFREREGPSQRARSDDRIGG